MAIRTRIDSTTGTVSTKDLSGTLLGRDASNKGFLPFPDDSVLTASTTSALSVANCGLNVVSSSAAVTLTMPDANGVAGGMLAFRMGSAHAHILTASLAPLGSTPFTDGTAKGSKVTFAVGVGNSAVFMSDGVNFLVMGRSGSLTIA